MQADVLLGSSLGGLPHTFAYWPTFGHLGPVARSWAHRTPFRNVHFATATEAARLYFLHRRYRICLVICTLYFILCDCCPWRARAWTNVWFVVFLQCLTSGFFERRRRRCRMGCDKMPLMNTSQMKPSRCSAFETERRLQSLLNRRSSCKFSSMLWPDFCLVVARTSLWVPRKHFNRSFDKYAVCHYNSFYRMSRAHQRTRTAYTIKI